MCFRIFITEGFSPRKQFSRATRDIRRRTNMHKEQRRKEVFREKFSRFIYPAVS